MPSTSTYGIAKSGVIFFSQGLAKMAIRQGININVVAPGWSLTNFDKSPPEEIIKRFTPGTPIRRATEQQEIADAVAFLASDVAADIVGQVLSVDGGSTL